MRLAYETLKNAEIEQQTINTLEMIMWKSCILAGSEDIQFASNDYIFKKLKTELLSDLDKLPVTCSLADETEQKSAEVLINKLLDLGKLDIALRISVIFNYNHKVNIYHSLAKNTARTKILKYYLFYVQDLQILMLCLSLAEGEMTPTDLTVQQRNLLEETNKGKQQKYSTLRNRGLQRLPSQSSCMFHSFLEH